MESQYQRFKRMFHYRRSEVEGEKCGMCYFMTRAHRGTRNYTKCILLGVSASEATDIAQRNVCDLFCTAIVRRSDDLGRVGKVRQEKRVLCERVMGDTGATSLLAVHTQV